MSNSSAPVGVRLRVDIAPDCSIGPGKIALLEQIERSGSLSQAARVLKMSYRRAWLLLEDLNRTLGQPVTTASVGGAGGGGARITPFGRHVVVAFREIELAAVTAAAQQLDWLLQSGMAAHVAPVAPRRAVTRALARSREAASAAGTGTAAADPAVPVTQPSTSAGPVKSAAALARPKKRGRVAKRP